jgi:hypothetical protein
MVARSWLSIEEVVDALAAAADTCGLNADDGEEATRGCEHELSAASKGERNAGSLHACRLGLVQRSLRG